MVLLALFSRFTGMLWSCILVGGVRICVKRLLRNRVSAQQARERKKAYLIDLEARVKDLENKNSELEEKLSTLQNENQMLRHVCHPALPSFALIYSLIIFSHQCLHFHISQFSASFWPLNLNVLQEQPCDLSMNLLPCLIVINSKIYIYKLSWIM